jgi:glycerol-3-phosphate acyltransferase PlsY
MHPYTAATALIAALLVWRHKSNIKNLLAGTEPRIGAKRA